MRRSIKNVGTRVDVLQRILQIYQRQFAATAQATNTVRVNIIESRQSVDMLSQILNQDDDESMMIKSFLIMFTQTYFMTMYIVYK